MNPPDAKTRRTMLIIAGCIFLAAMVWLIVLASTSYTARLCRRINGFGYHAGPSDFYTRGYGTNTSISEVIEEDLAEVMLQSRACGFPADVTKIGKVELMLWDMEDGKVMVVWLVDREPELVFIEETGTGKTYKIG